MDGTYANPRGDSSSVEQNHGGSTASNSGFNSSVDVTSNNNETTSLSEDRPFDESSSTIDGSSDNDEYVSFSNHRQPKPVSASCESNDDVEQQPNKQRGQGEQQHHHQQLETADGSCAAPPTTSSCCCNTMLDGDDGDDKNDIIDHSVRENHRSVRFDTIEIREYPIHLGSSIPNCGGVPIGIDWMPRNNHNNNNNIFNVEDYENIIKPPSARRHIEQLILSSAHRYGMLIDHGVDHTDINTSIKECDEIRVERMKSSSSYLKQRKRRGKGRRRRIRETLTNINNKSRGVAILDEDKGDYDDDDYTIESNEDSLIMNPQTANAMNDILLLDYFFMLSTAFTTKTKKKTQNQNRHSQSSRSCSSSNDSVETGMSSSSSTSSSSSASSTVRTPSTFYDICCVHLLGD